MSESVEQAAPPTTCPSCRRKVVPIKAKFGPAFTPTWCGCGQRLVPEASARG